MASPHGSLSCDSFLARKEPIHHRVAETQKEHETGDDRPRRRRWLEDDATPADEHVSAAGTLTASSRRLEIGEAPVLASIGGMVLNGFEHVLDGADHLLFLAVLFLPAPLVARGGDGDAAMGSPTPSRRSSRWLRGHTRPLADTDRVETQARVAPPNRLPGPTRIRRLLELALALGSRGRQGSEARTPRIVVASSVAKRGSKSMQAAFSSGRSRAARTAGAGWAAGHMAAIRK